ncbi:MAG TPA: BTAD domain-containing putative transcriptional regulator, partial [Candidatus Limnocylindrales bacterium]|nr:BTAD domain-containing putative transcriptional regulator [Candidatus Limnocylindrales bacterium]
DTAERATGPGAAAVGRSAKLLPPSDPIGTLRRPVLEQRITGGTDRRLTVVVGGAGFGKSTLAARVATNRRSAWYTLDASDRHLGALTAGIVAAIRIVVPELPADLAGPIEGSIEATDEAGILSRANAAAALLSDALDQVLDEPLLLVLDDLHVLVGAPVAWRLVESLVRLAPAELHLMITSRTELPFSVERLRGQGQVADLGGSMLAFSEHEIGSLVGILLAEEVPSPTERPVVAKRIHAATGGWPAAVRLAIEAVRGAPPGDQAAVLDRLQRPEGPLFAYLAEEVVSAAPPATRELVRRAVHFERFNVALLEATGVPEPAATIAELAKRALFLQPLPGEPGWYALHGLIREYTLSRLPLPADEIRSLHRAAAAWFEAQGVHESALTSWIAAGDQPALARFLSEHAQSLVLGGATRQVVEAAAHLPDELRDARIERACGEATMVRGQWRDAMGHFRRAAGEEGKLDAATAWRMGLVHALRGAYDDALKVFARAERGDTDPVNEALLSAYIASSQYHRGNVEAALAASQDALERAQAVGDQRALAAAHTAMGFTRELTNDPTDAAAQYTLALAAAERAGDALQMVRILNARGALELELGRFEPALSLLDEAVRLGDAVGFASFHARALVNRGRARQGIGRFEEAMADFIHARDIYERIGSPQIAYALTREGSMHALRGDAFLARAAFENAVRSARSTGDSHALAPALIGLAQAVVLDDPDGAAVMAEEALALGRELAPVTILLGAGRVALATGDRAAAETLAREATVAARSRRDDPGMAAGLELEALTTTDPDRAIGLVEEAATIWMRSPAPYGVARNQLVYARIAGGSEGRAAAIEAERAFRSMGARGPASDAEEIVEAIDRANRPAIRIQSLGRFRVVRDGDVVPTTAWQSKKARDLLKILVARRGRPTTRDTFFELLWPDDDPEPLGNRLSVALATVRAVLDPEKRFGPDWFVPADKSAIGLDLEHVELDVELFLAAAAHAERLARNGDAAAARTSREDAERLYGGDFLEEDPYEDWAVALREEAQATYIALARTLAEDAAASGDADGATRFYLRILERDPFDEGAHLGLIAALVAAGRHGEARRRYGFYATKMEEISVEAAPFPSAPSGTAAGSAFASTPA